MFSINCKKFIYTLILIITFLYIQGCAVLTPSQVDAVGDFASAADNYTQLPGSVVEMHANTMYAENVFTAASISNSIAADKINKDVEFFLKSLKKSAEADAALSVIDTYVKLLQKLTSADFTEKLQEEAAALGTEIDGGINQFNEHSDSNIDSFGAVVAASVRAVGGIIIRKKQTEALKEAVQGAEPMINEMSKSILALMDLYICEVDKHGNCLMDENGISKSGLAQLSVEGLVDEYKGLLNSGKSNNSVNDVLYMTDLLLKAKAIKPLAEKSKQAMITFQAAHTKLYNKLQESQDLDGTIEEINVLAGEVKSAQRFKKEIESQEHS